MKERDEEQWREEMGSVEKGENRRGDKRSEKRLQKLKEVKEEEKVIR